MLLAVRWEVCSDKGWREFAYTVTVETQWGHIAQDRDCTGLFPSQVVNEVQPVTAVYFYGTWCLTFLDLGCSRSILNTKLCWFWSWWNAKGTTICGEARVYCRVSMVKICTETGNTVEVKVLIVGERLLDFSLWLTINTIKAQGVHITHAGDVLF